MRRGGREGERERVWAGEGVRRERGSLKDNHIKNDKTSFFLGQTYRFLSYKK